MSVISGKPKYAERRATLQTLHPAPRNFFPRGTQSSGAPNAGRVIDVERETNRPYNQSFQNDEAVEGAYRVSRGV